MINDAFLNYLPKYVLDALKAKPGALNNLIRMFDRNVKPGFKSAGDWDRANKEIWINLDVTVHDNPGGNIQGGKLRITG